MTSQHGRRGAHFPRRNFSDKRVRERVRVQRQKGHAEQRGVGAVSRSRESLILARFRPLWLFSGGECAERGRPRSSQCGRRSFSDVSAASAGESGH